MGNTIPAPETIEPVCILDIAAILTETARRPPLRGEGFMDAGNHMPRTDAMRTEKQFWIEPEIKSLNASAAAVAKEIIPEGGAASIDLG